MNKLRCFNLGKLLIGVVMLGIFCLLIAPASPVLAADNDIAVTIKGDGVKKQVQLTMAELQALPQETHDYTGYNYYPSLQIFKQTTGVTLKTLLDQAGLKDEATMIKIKGPNMSYSYYTRRDLLDLPRYYFPVGEDGSDNSTWPPANRGSEEGKVQVPTIIAFMDNGKLIFGQQTPLEPTACNGEMIGGLLPGCTIEVTTETLEKWDKPDAYPGPGSVIPGTQVTLKYGDGSHWHTRIYYTLDGSEPSVKSNLFNVSYPTFQPDLNKPIPINGKITIKAKAIGLGKLDSDTVTFNYDVGSLACKVEGPDINSIFTIETLKRMAPAQGIYQCLDNGQTVSLSGSGVLLSTLLDELKAHSNWEVKFVTVSGEEIAGGTVQNIRDQQCMLAYEVNGKEISDVSGDKTVKIQILRNVDAGSSSAGRLQFVNAIKLVNVDDIITVNAVKLMDYSGAPMTSAAPGGGYSIEVNAVNAVSTVKNAILIVQVRTGNDAARTNGGQVVAFSAAQTAIGVKGGKFKTEFTLPRNVRGTAYVDVFVWDNFSNHNPLGSENHTLSFEIK